MIPRCVEILYIVIVVVFSARSFDVNLESVPTNTEGPMILQCSETSITVKVS